MTATIHALPTATRPGGPELIARGTDEALASIARHILGHADHPAGLDAILASLPPSSLPDVIRAITRETERLFDLANAQGCDLWTEVL